MELPPLDEELIAGLTCDRLDPAAAFELAVLLEESEALEVTLVEPARLLVSEVSPQPAMAAAINSSAKILTDSLRDPSIRTCSRLACR